MSGKTRLRWAIWILLCCFCNAILNGHAQEHESGNDADTFLKDIIESIAENLPEEYDLYELTERLVYYSKHPVKLNKTSPEELKNLIFLSPLQVSNFFRHLQTNGQLLDILELQSIDGFDPETIQRLRPFVTLNPPDAFTELKLKNLAVKSNSDLILRYGRLIEQRKGFRYLPGSRYLGSPEKLLMRYKYAYADQLSFSLVMEKDAGEQLTRGKIPADHFSGSVGLYQIGRIKKLVLGDYSLQFGQGLTLWSGFAYGKGPDVTSVAAKDAGLRPYTSANEASFFRGIASTVALADHIDLSTFVSYRNLDASLKMLPDSSFTLSNINISGLHRTANELKNQGNLRQLVYGGVVQYVSNNLGIGLVVNHSEYGHEFITGTQAYNKYAFTGNKLLNAGLHYQYTFRNVYLYGETATSMDGGWAMINGAMASLTSWLSAVLVHRNYDKDYHNFFSQAVGEATEVNNEKGLYIGLNFMPSKKWTFSIYGDYFRFPWLKYRIDSASYGYDVLSQLVFKPHKRFKALVRYKIELKQQNPDAESDYPYLQYVKKESLRLECYWGVNKKWSFQWRSEASSYQKGDNKTETGYMIYQDLNYTPMSSRISGNVRLAYFNTPSYNSRIYAYEDDVLYGAGSGMYNGHGVRTFINLRYRLTRQMDIWGKYALFVYQGQDKIGSGLDEIPGNKKSEVKLQIRYQF